MKLRGYSADSKQAISRLMKRFKAQNLRCRTCDPWRGSEGKQRIAEAIRNFSLLAIAIDYLFKTFRPEGNNVLVSIALVTAAITSFYWAHEFRDRCERFKAIYLQHVKEAE